MECMSLMATPTLNSHADPIQPRSVREIIDPIWALRRRPSGSIHKNAECSSGGGGGGEAVGLWG